MVPLYLGDDVTDEDAFRALNGLGVAVYVGDQHELAQSAEKMLGSIEDFVRELRCFDVSGQTFGADTFEGS